MVGEYLHVQEEQKHQPPNYEKIAIPGFREQMKLLGFSNHAITAAEAVVMGGKAILPYHNQSIQVLQTQRKPDKTLVTAADHASEAAIRAVLNRHFNGDVMGEEWGLTENVDGTDASSVFDPVDGSYPFATGRRSSAVALEINAEPDGYQLAAAIYNPFKRNLLVAEEDAVYEVPVSRDSLPEGERRGIRFSPNQSLEGGAVCIDSFFVAKSKGRKSALIDPLIDLARNNLQLIMTGSNVDYQRLILMSAARAGITDCVGGPWDIEIGGRMIKKAGGEFTVMNEGELAVYSDGGKYHEAICEIVQNIYEGYAGFR